MTAEAKPLPQAIRPSGAHIAFAAYVAGKVALALLYGPLTAPDSGGYTGFADSILSGRYILNPAELNGSDSSVFRMPGYPALIALAKVFFEDNWALALIQAQTLVSVTVTCLLFRASQTYTRRPWIAWAVATSYALSPLLQLDLFILTDSLYINLLVLVLLALLALSARPSGRIAGPSLVIGAALPAAFLLREATWPLGLLFGIPLVVCLLRDHRSVLKKTLVLSIALMPLVCASTAIGLWNEHRTGVNFITTGTRTALLLSLLTLEGNGTPVFQGDTPLDQAARKAMAESHNVPKDFGITESLAANGFLLTQGMNEIEVQKLVTSRFREVFVFHPDTIVRRFLQTFGKDVLFFTFNAPTLLRDLDYWVNTGRFEGIRAFLSKAWNYPSPGRIIWLGTEIAARLIALVILVLYVTAPIGLWLTRKDRPWQLPLALWLAANGFCGAYSLVHLEPRYLAGLLPVIWLVALGSWDNVASKWWGRYRAA